MRRRFRPDTTVLEPRIAPSDITTMTNIVGNPLADPPAPGVVVRPTLFPSITLPYGPGLAPPASPLIDPFAPRPAPPPLVLPYCPLG